MQLNRYLNLLLLLALSLVLSFASPLATNIQDTVLPMLLGAAFSAFILFFDWRDQGQLAGITSLLFALLTLLIPGFVFYWPLIIYVYGKPYLLILLLISQAVNLDLDHIAFTGITLAITLLAWRMQASDEKIQYYHTKYLQTSDNAREMELTLKRQYRELLDKQDNELYTATLNERNRIAREMHDQAGHLLSRALLQVGALLAVSPDHKGLSEVKGTLNLAMDSLRNSVHNLYDTSIDLASECQQTLSVFQFCPVNLNVDYTEEPPRQIKLTTIAILKEGLSNISHHSNATRADFSFIEHRDFYQLILSDNGSNNSLRTTEASGLEVSQTSSGIGIASIAKRVETLNGRFLIKAQHGFTLFITLPKEHI